MGTLIRPVALCFVLSVGPLSFSQQNGYPAGELYEEKRKADEQLETLKQQLPPEEFYREGGEYAEHEKWFRLWEQRVGGHGDPEAYHRVMETYMNWKFNGNSSYKSNNDPWQEIGPVRRRNNFVGAGPIRDIVINKLDHEHMLCTSPNGGMFYSTDGAENWQNAGTDQGWPTTGCSHAAYYPGSLSKWFGTNVIAEKRGQQMIGYTGGVYRTVNSGADWERIAGPDDLTGSWQTTLEKLVFDDKLNSLNDHRLFLATSNGLWMTDDPSATDPTWYTANIMWPPSLLALPNCTMGDDVIVRDLAYLPISGTSTMAAAMRFSVVCTTGYDQNNNPILATQYYWRFMASDDNGLIWEEIPGQPAPNTIYTVAGVETTPAQGSYFYFLLSSGRRNPLPRDGSLHKYETATNVWQEIALGPNEEFSSEFNTCHEFAVDIATGSSILVANDVELRLYTNGVYQQLLTYDWPYQHDDVEGIVADPGSLDVYWVANHGGIDKLTVVNGLGTYEDMSDGLGVTEVTSFASAESDPGFVALSLFHSCGAITRTPYAQNWSPDWAYLELKGDGIRALIDRRNPDHVLHAVQNGSWVRHDQATMSTSNSGSFNTGTLQHKEFWSEGDLNRATSGHVYLNTDVNNGSTNYTNANGQTVAYTNWEPEIFRSFDRGVTRVVVSNFRSDPAVCRSASGNSDFNAEQIQWIRSSTANPDHLYVCIRGWDWKFRIYRTTMVSDADVNAVAASWEEVPVPRYWDVAGMAGIAFDPENEDVIYIAYASPSHDDPADWVVPYSTRTVYRMDVSNLAQYGAGSGNFDCTGPEPCDDITMNLPNTFATKSALVYEQGSDEGLYLATEVGVYFTNRKRIMAHDPLNPQDPDLMTNTAGWVRVGDGLPHTACGGVEINYAVNRMRIGFYGRGLWEHGLHCPEVPSYAEYGTYATSDFLEAQNEITSEAILPTGLSMKYRAGTEVHLRDGFHAAAGSAFHAFIHPCDYGGNSFAPKNASTDPPNWDGQQLTTGRSDLLVVPNPNRGAFQVILSGYTAQSHGVARLLIFDALGRAVLDAPYTANGQQCVLDGRTGLFQVVLLASGNRYSTKLVVE